MEGAMNSTDKAQAQEEEFEIIEGDAPNEEIEQQHEDNDDQEDERLSDTNNEEEEARREAKRNERKRRKENQRYARDKTKEEMQWLIEQNRVLQSRLEAVESHAFTAQKGTLEQNYQQAAYSVSQAEQALAKAIELGDGARVPELLRQRDQAMAKVYEVNRARQGLEATPQQTRPQTPSMVEMKARQWAADNAWFKADGSDTDSEVVRAIDAALTKEGLDPTSNTYWDELDNRISKYLPHRFAEEEDSGYSQSRGGRKGPPVGGGREMSAPGSKKVYVSAERVNAMKEAGYWDDPVMRQRMLKRYAETDRELKSAR
jgi:hypothetical protein